jgi:hypothetical protein
MKSISWHMKIQEQKTEELVADVVWSHHRKNTENFYRDRVHVIVFVDTAFFFFKRSNLLLEFLYGVFM